MDMAERNGELLRLWLCSADCFSERATWRALRFLNTSGSRSSASLSRITRADQRFCVAGMAASMAVDACLIACGGDFRVRSFWGGGNCLKTESAKKKAAPPASAGGGAAEVETATTSPVRHP